jgi:hypothetical protein
MSLTTPLPHRMHPPTAGVKPVKPVEPPAEDGPSNPSSQLLREHLTRERRLAGKQDPPPKPPPPKPVVSPRERWLSYVLRVRKVYITSRCQLCPEPINRGQQYRDGGGLTGKAHEACVLALPEAEP